MSDDPMAPFDGRDFVEMPPMEMKDLLRFLSSMPPSESCCGASLLPCGHYLSFMRINGQTLFLGHHDGPDAAKVGDLATALIDVLDEIAVREHGGRSVDMRYLTRDLLMMGRDEPTPPIDG